jgi:hypothetical protein
VRAPSAKGVVLRPLEPERLRADTRLQRFVIDSRRKSHRVVTMKSIHSDQVLDVSALAAIVAAMGLLVPAFFMPGLGALAVPAFVLLLAGMLCGTR